MKNSQAHEQLEELKNRFDQWRQNRLKKGPIPEELWEAAIELSKDVPIYRISRVTRLEYSALKRKVEERRQQILQEPPSIQNYPSKADNGFIELRMNPLHPPDFSPARYCIVEMEKHDGSRMKIVSYGDPIDATQLGTLFLRSDS
jgi:hypothetical protein